LQKQERNTRSLHGKYEAGRKINKAKKLFDWLAPLMAPIITIGQREYKRV